MKVGDLVNVFTGLSDKHVALAIITEIEPIQAHDGACVYHVHFVDDNPFGVSRKSFKFSSHYIQQLEKICK
jgi:hypothetical protein